MAEQGHNMGARDGPDIEADALDWVSKVGYALSESQEDRGEERAFIFKIPEFYRSSWKHFTPVEWRFGLHNRENLHTGGSEAIKISAAAAFGLLGPKWDDFCDDVVDDPVRLLKLYGLNDRLSNFNEREAKYVLALDALFFVLMFDCISKQSFTNPALLSLFTSRRTMPRLELIILGRDIALVENQIPMALLRKVVNKCNGYVGSDEHELIRNHQIEEVILDRILKRSIAFANPLIDKLKHTDGKLYPVSEYLDLTYPPGTLGECDHILDCVYNMICGPKGVLEVAGDYFFGDYVRVESATNLKASGIEIKPFPGTLEDIAFQNGCLYLPVIVVGERTEPILRNIALYEAFSRARACKFRDYLQLMLNLISGPNDVKLLAECGVLYSDLGNDTKVFEVWNDLGEGLITPPSSESFHQMKASIVKHCKSKKNVILAEFDLLFCSRPWYVISVITVTFVTIATCIQAYTSVIGSDNMRPHFPSH